MINMEQDGYEQPFTRSKQTGVVIVPNLRFDGDSDAPPWNIPERTLRDWLSGARVEPGVIGGRSRQRMSLAWGTALNHRDEPVGLIIKFDGL